MADDVLRKEFEAQSKAAWLRHPNTSDFFIKLEMDRQRLLDECENLSVSTPMDKDTIVNKLAQSKKLKEIISYAKIR